MSEAEPKPTTVNTLAEAIEHVDKAHTSVGEAVNKARNAFQELTGYKPEQPVTAFDVIKIVYSHWGEPKGD